MKIKLLLLSLLFSILIIGCQSNKTQIANNASVIDLVNEYGKESLKFNPVSATFRGIEGYNDQFSPALTKENRAKALAFEKYYLDRINQFDENKLSGQELLTYKIFKHDRETSIESAKFPSHMLPFNQMSGIHNFFATLASGKNAQPFKSEQDYRNFIKRAKGFSIWMDSAIESMREGIKIGVVQPKPIILKIIPQMKAHVTDDIKQSIFYKPLENIPAGLNKQQKSQLIADYEKSIREVMIPTYKKMHDFMVDEYLPNGRETFGLSEFPNGKNWYEFMIKRHTTLNLSADEIHEYGKQEVARILAEMKKVKKQVKFKADLAAFFNFLRNDPQFYFDTEEDLIQAYSDAKIKINSKLPKLFEVFPKADYVVQAVPKFRAASAAGASYHPPALDGSRPGIFFINSYNLKSQPKFLIETLSIHEAAPGHHFQIAIQQEVKDLSEYRKLRSYTVFAEGWALYAESLGKELGLFTDPYMWYGRLVDEQLRAMRLVIDTGLHAKGWTRQQAIDFMLNNSSMAESDVESEVERYIAIPGQALAYKIGERKVRQLREYAQKKLGEKFDIKKFHTQLLIDGSLPMPVLEEKIKTWVSSLQ